MDSDGSNRRRLTNDLDWDGFPVHLDADGVGPLAVGESVEGELWPPVGDIDFFRVSVSSREGLLLGRLAARISMAL